MDKKSLSETDIRTKFITPAIQAAGWDMLRQVREEVTFTAGRIVVRGRLHTRGTAKRADYVLYHQSNLPLAVIEAKDNKQSMGSGNRSSHGTCKLISEKLWSFKVSLPPLAEQRRIVAKVDELMALGDQLKAQLAEARQQHAQLATALVEQAVAA